MSFVTQVKHLFSRTFGNRSRNFPSRLGGSWFYPLGMSSLNISEIQAMEAFFVPEVNAVLNKGAMAHASIKLEVVSKRTEQPVTNKLSQLIARPNWFQTSTEFIQQSNLFHDLFGNEYMYFMSGIGMPAERAKALYTLYPSYIDVEYNDARSYFFEVEPPDIKYTYSFGGNKTPLEAEKVLHLNDNNVDYHTDEDIIKGESKLKSIARPINNIIAAYEARGVLIRHRGALGILSNDGKDGLGASLTLDDKERDNLQNEYKKYGITEDQYNIIITNLSLKWQKMALDVGQLKLFEEVREDAIKVAEAFNYPPELLKGEGTPNLFGDNKKEAERAWYQNSIIPEAQMRVDGLNAKFKTEGLSYHIVGKFDHLPVLQKDKKDQANVMALVTNSLSKMFTDGAITLQQYQDELKRNGFIE